MANYFNILLNEGNVYMNHKLKYNFKIVSTEAQFPKWLIF